MVSLCCTLLLLMVLSGSRRMMLSSVYQRWLRWTKLGELLLDVLALGRHCVSLQDLPWLEASGTDPIEAWCFRARRTGCVCSSQLDVCSGGRVRVIKPSSWQDGLVASSTSELGVTFGVPFESRDGGWRAAQSGVLGGTWRTLCSFFASFAIAVESVGRGESTGCDHALPFLLFRLEAVEVKDEHPTTSAADELLAFHGGQLLKPSWYESAGVREAQPTGFRRRSGRGPRASPRGSLMNPRGKRASSGAQWSLMRSWDASTLGII